MAYKIVPKERFPLEAVLETARKELQAAMKEPEGKNVASLRGKVASLEANKSNFEARRRNRCRAIHCTHNARPSRVSGSTRKNSRGKQLFCGSHVGLGQAIGTAKRVQLIGNDGLRVTVA